MEFITILQMFTDQGVEIVAVFYGELYHVCPFFLLQGSKIVGVSNKVLSGISFGSLHSKVKFVLHPLASVK